MKVLETERLVLRRATVADAAFILRLVNEPAWKQHIGDRGMKTEEEARAYLEKSFIEMYGRLGHGLYVAERREDGAPVGICGILRRDTLDAVDLGFALLGEFEGRGYALEAARAVLAHEARVHRFGRVLAITSPGNARSERLLARLGFTFERRAELAPGKAPVNIFSLALPAQSG
jgi:RimJ/RimL family protein N-acetyltransferase